MALSPVCLSGEFYGEMSLMGYSPWGHKESDTTEHTYISRFLNLRITDILGQIIFCCGSSPVCCKMYTSILTFTPLDPGEPLSSHFNKQAYLPMLQCLQRCWGRDQLRITVLKDDFHCSCLVTKSCPTFCNPMDCSTPGFPVLSCLPEFTQIHVHWVIHAI